MYTHTYIYIYDISTCHIGKNQTLNVLEESKDIPICPDPLTSGSAIESDQSSDFAPASPPHLLPCFHLHLLLHPPRCRTWAITNYRCFLDTNSFTIIVSG